MVNLTFQFSYLLLFVSNFRPGSLQLGGEFVTTLLFPFVKGNQSLNLASQVGNHIANLNIIQVSPKL